MLELLLDERPRKPVPVEDDIMTVVVVGWFGVSLYDYVS